MTAAAESDFIKPTEIARRLDVHRQTVYRWCREGVIPAIRIGTGETTTVRVRRSEFEKWLSKQPSASS